MSFPITSIHAPQAIQPIQLNPTSNTTAPAAGGDFKNVLNSAIQQVESSRTNANNAVQSYLSGENQELHSTILATQTAELQFDMFMQVRNKVVGAYQEIMKMQV
jgi:flagellar hook-basal body complex protein FliE